MDTQSSAILRFCAAARVRAPLLTTDNAAPVVPLRVPLLVADLFGLDDHASAAKRCPPVGFLVDQQIIMANHRYAEG